MIVDLPYHSRVGESGQFILKLFAIEIPVDFGRENFGEVIIGSFAVDAYPSALSLPRWRIWTEFLKLFAIEIPVAKISPDDDRGGRRGGVSGKSAPCN